MSIFRRPTRAAGYSWRKWEDPIVYAAPIKARLAFLISMVLLGVVVGATYALIDYAVPTWQKMIGLIFMAILLVAIAAELTLAWGEMTENE